MRHGYCINCGQLRELTCTLECRTCCGVRTNAEAVAARNEHEPTEAEVEAMVAENLPTMPGRAALPAKAVRRPVTLPKRSRKETRA